MPDELWMEVRDIVQETGIKTIPMEKKCKEAKWLSEEALQIAVKRREAKSKGERKVCACICRYMCVCVLRVCTHVFVCERVRVCVRAHRHPCSILSDVGLH